MKFPKNILVWAAILSASVGTAADQPLARLRVRSYTDLTNAISRLAATVNPSDSADHGLQFSEAMGLTNFEVFDTERPWEIAVWFGGAGSPLVAVKAPAQDLTKFKKSLNPAGALPSKAQDWIPLTNGWSLLVFSKIDSLSAAEKSALDEWKSQAIAPPTRLLELNVSLNETLRQQGLAMVPIGKMGATQAMAAQNSKATNGLNPAAMEGTVAVFFDTLQTLVTGLQDVTIELDLLSDAISVDKTITAKPGTDLANWMQKPAGQVTSEDLNWIRPDSSLAVGAYFGKDPALLNLVQRMMQLGFQMQNLETNGAAAKDLDKLMAKLLPSVFAGSMDMKDKLTFAGAYRFPAANLDEVYGEMKRFLTNSFQSFAGKDKMYSACSLVEKHHTVGGVAVDRFTMMINADYPLFKLPGQKEQLELMWPNGKMEIDYAIKDGHLLMASGDRMKELLEPGSAPSNRKAMLKLGEGTVVAGYVNVLNLVRQMSAANPAIPDAVKEKMAQLDGRDSGVEFQVRADHQLFISARIPLKLLRELGRLKGD